MGGVSLRVHRGRLRSVLFAAVVLALPVLPLAPNDGLAAVSGQRGGQAQGTTPTATATATAITGPVPVQEHAVPRHYVVLIVIDGDRPSYLSLGHLPHIQALMNQGVVYDRAWVGELESSTPNVHVTFGTGTLPRENGFLGFGWAAPQTRKIVDFRSLLANHAIDPVLRSLPVPSVAARLHEYMPNAISVAASGHKDYAVVGLGGGAASYELYGKIVNHQLLPAFMHGPPPLSPAELQGLTIAEPKQPGDEDSWAFRYALAVAQRVRPRLLMLNLPETDTWGHWYGPARHVAFAQLMENIDRGIGQIEATYRRLGILNRTDFIITADHAMMESRAVHNWPLVWDAAKAVGATIARANGEAGAIWLGNPGQAKAVARRLVTLWPNHVEAIFYRSGLGPSYTYLQASPRAWLTNAKVAAALRYLVNTTAGQNGPDVWMLYRENYTAEPYNVQGVWKGTHGGTTWKVQNVPLIVSGPGIRQGVHSPFPARAIDVTPTMERLLGLPATKRDGVLLADALLNPPEAGVAAQEKSAPALDADVTALQAQSQADDRSQRPFLPVSPILRCGVSPHQRCTITPTNQ